MKKILMLLFIGLAIANETRNPLHVLQHVLKKNENLSVETVNEVVDQLLIEMRDLIRNHELTVEFYPMILPYILQNFNVQSTDPPINEKLILLEGTETGFESIHRGDNSIFNSNEDFFNITIFIAYEKLSINYDYILKIKKQRGEGKLLGELKDFGFYVTIHIDRITFYVDLHDFGITNAGTISVDVKGNHHSDWLLKQNPDELKKIIRNLHDSFTLSQMQKAVVDLVIDANKQSI